MTNADTEQEQEYNRNGTLIPTNVKTKESIQNQGTRTMTKKTLKNKEQHTRQDATNTFKDKSQHMKTRK